MKLPKNLAMLLAAIWFILYGLLSNSFVTLRITHGGDILAVLAIVVGVLFFLQR